MTSFIYGYHHKLSVDRLLSQGYEVKRLENFGLRSGKHEAPVVQQIIQDEDYLCLIVCIDFKI